MSALAVAGRRPTATDDVSLLEERRCGWCRASLLQQRQRFCSKRCRQTAFRLSRRRGITSGVVDAGALFAYADPPYPGLAARYYSDQPTYAGEVDHRALVQRLEASGYAGWALSTSAAALSDVLPLCPRGARVAAWVKPIGVSRKNAGLSNVWEPLIVVRGRARPPGVRDFLIAQPARGGGTLPGRKPIAFCAWLFDLLGMLPGDRLDDLFPGTGVVTNAWRAVSSKYSERSKVTS